MAMLSIERFSCISSAKFETSRCTVIIGEQASGKSIITKLAYFMNHIVISDFLRYTEFETVSEIKNHIAENFEKWFPPLAWGERRFTISYVNGPLSIEIRRKGLGKKSRQSANVEFSPYFQEIIDEFYRKVKKANEDFRLRWDDDDAQFRRFELINDITKQTRRDLRQGLPSPLPALQLFIPAGRSFFTSLGKAIPAFERSGMLDPITIRFGEFFLSAKQRLGGSGRGYYFPQTRRNAEIKSNMEKFFGGRFVFKKDDEFIETADGRLIPLPFLSSGQQELLPLWFSVEQAYHFRDNFNLYIEEPEAHIFPTTQNFLIQSLVAYLIGGKSNANVIMTTHSPYVLAKINNLIKAAIVGEQRGKATAVGELIPRDAWLHPSIVSAYAIDSGELRSIIDDDGLIDGEYLDNVSNEISEEYMKLVEIECS